MNNNPNQEPPPQNVPPPMVRPNGQAPRTMEELCQPSINGRGGLIAPIPIQATDFGLRHHMIQQAQNTCQFHGCRLEMINKNFSEMMRQFQTIKDVDTSETCSCPHSFTERPAIGGYTQKTRYATTGMGSLPRNTIPNPQEDLEVITNRSGVTLVGPSVSPSSSSKEVDREPNTITNQVLTGSTNNVSPLVVQPSPASTSFSTISSSKMPEKLHKKLGDPDKFLIPCDFLEFDECLALPDLVVAYVVDPRVPLILGRPFLRTRRALIDVYGEELTLRVDDEAITFKVGQTSKYSYNDVESINRVNIIDVAYEKIDDTDLDLEGDIRLLEELLNNDPSLSHLPSKELNVKETKTVKSSIDEPPELELKELSSHLEYAYLEGVEKLPVIIAKNLKDDENEAVLKVLKLHKWAIAWKISDIKGIDPRFCTHKILMEDDFKPTVQS
nr:hypothetical protein [Tanacetum cinerariifolium]